MDIVKFNYNVSQDNFQRLLQKQTETVDQAQKDTA